ncbi:hypothetical protein [Parafrankia elaeagni]|uniref:hypothetical protein n=1 Tax=Parafrankia elaeagni TaxID=222534 RepID=UPI0003A926D4|nr:hypothetical protein [Parafrankia elaeagni]
MPWGRGGPDPSDDGRPTFNSELGRTRIEGENVVSTFDIAHRPDMPNFPVLYQGGIRYRWDGEETYGMLERSTMRDKIIWS